MSVTSQEDFTVCENIITRCVLKEILDKDVASILKETPKALWGGSV